MEFILLIAVLIGGIFAVAKGIGMAIGFVRNIDSQYDYGFFGLSFWTVVASLIGCIYVTINITPEYWGAFTLFGLIAVAGFINIRSLGPRKGLIFTALQCASVYLAVLVWIIYSLVKASRDKS